MVNRVLASSPAIQCHLDLAHVKWHSLRAVISFEVPRHHICHASTLEKCLYSRLHLGQELIRMRQDIRYNKHKLSSKRLHHHPSTSIIGSRQPHRRVQAVTTRLQHHQASIRIHCCPRLEVNESTDQTSSPRKRKATGSQQPAPPPTSQPQYTSPPFSQGSASVSSTPQGRRRGHSRQRSDVSARGFDYGRSNRHPKTEGGFTSRNLASPIQSADNGQPSLGSRRHSGGAHTVSSMLQQNDVERQSQHQEFHVSPRTAVGSDARQREQYTPESDPARYKSMIKRDSARE